MAKPQRKKPRYQIEAEKPNRIPADPAQQAPNNSYDPPSFDEDYRFNCVDCGVEQVWTAEQQKWWYEVAKGSIYSRATRCRSCREKHRNSNQNSPQ